MSNSTELSELAEAVRKLVKAKGRFHTEQNYKELADALARYDARRAQPEGCGCNQGQCCPVCDPVHPVKPVAQVYLDLDNWMDVAVEELPVWERKGYTTRRLYAAPSPAKESP